jgi:hypothetical protein
MGKINRMIASVRMRPNENSTAACNLWSVWIIDAHRDDGRRFIVRVDEKLTAFLELERAVCIHLLSTHKIKFDTLSLIE